MHTMFIPCSLPRILLLALVLVAPAALSQESGQETPQAVQQQAEQDTARGNALDENAQDESATNNAGDAEPDTVADDAAGAAADDTVAAVTDSEAGSATDDAEYGPTGNAADIAEDYTTDFAKEMPAAYVTSSHQILAYNRAIQEAESREGAYGGSLSESLLGLAQLLQSQGRHDEAIKLYKRGVHLTRINEGLYSTQQIPLLQGEIASHKALKAYSQADERQNYLYRVQTKSFGSGEALAAAFMDQARWQYDAYQLGLAQDGYTRLMDMWELYRLAFNDVIAREGKTSPNLLPPLHGMLQTQYLISSYDIRPSTPVFGEDGQVDEGLLRFKTYHSQSYQQGNAVIEAIAGIEQERSAPDSPTRARTLVMLGDWRLWNGKTSAAWEAYREAMTELARAGDAQTHEQQLFGEPVALPNIAGMSLLPPVVEPDEDAITLAFGVSQYGRVQDVERLDDNAVEDSQAYHLMRQLRRTMFRPRFAAGQPVETEKLVKAFHIE